MEGLVQSQEIFRSDAAGGQRGGGGFDHTPHLEELDEGAVPHEVNGQAHRLEELVGFQARDVVRRPGGLEEPARMRARTASRNELRESPSLVRAISPSEVYRLDRPGQRGYLLYAGDGVVGEGQRLLQYDRGVRPYRRQRYPRVAVDHVEVERLAPRREIYPPDLPLLRQDIDEEP